MTEMSFTRFTLLFLLILAARVVAQDDTRATATWQVQKYDIVVTMPVAETDRSIISKANLTVKNVSSAPATTLTLRISPNAEISSVSVGGAAAEVTKREERSEQTERYSVIRFAFHLPLRELR